MLIWNLLIALVWCWLQGSYSPGNMIGGFVLGYFVLALLRNRKVIAEHSFLPRRNIDYFAIVPKVITLVAYFLWELLVANFRLAKDLLTPGIDIQPRILAVPLDAKTDAQITVFASLVTLTPGTLSVHVSDDRSRLYVHAMYAQDEGKAIEELKSGFERRVLEVMQ